MQALDECIYKRRSYRKYLNKVPEESKLDLLLKCALQSASPSNSQPIRFLKLETKSIKDKLFNLMKEGKELLAKEALEKGNPNRIKNKINFYWRYSEFIFRAPLLFAIGHSNDLPNFINNLKEFDFTLPEQSHETPLDITIGLSLQNFILKGTELGLGCCILTAPLFFIQQDFSKFLRVNNFKLKAFLTIGYPDEEAPPIERKKINDIYQVL